MKKYCTLKVIAPLALIILGVAWMMEANKLGTTGLTDASMWVPVPVFPDFC